MAGFIHHVYEEYPDWQFALSPNEELLAVMKDEVIEFLSAEKNFKTKQSVCVISPDRWPKWRKVAWGQDSSHLAVSLSNGVIVLIDRDGRQLHRVVYPDQLEADSVHGFIRPFASLVIRRARVDVYKGHTYKYELLALGFDGIIRSFLYNLKGLHVSGETLTLGSFGVDGSIVFYHQYSFVGRGPAAPTFSVLATSIHEESDTMALVGCVSIQQPKDSSHSSAVRVSSYTSLWRITDEMPYYEELHPRKASSPENGDEEADSKPARAAQPKIVECPPIPASSIFQTWRRMSKIPFLACSSGETHNIFPCSPISKVTGGLHVQSCEILSLRKISGDGGA